MKRKVYYIIAAGVVMAFIVLGVGPVVKLVAKKQLRNIFKEAEVAIRQVSIRPFNSVEFSDITIKKPSAYNIKCKRISAQCNLKKIFLNDCFVSAQLADKEINFNLTASCAIDLRNKSLDGEFLARDFFGGAVGGNVKATLETAPAYAVDLRIDNIDVEALIKNFKLEEKVQATGKFNGNISVKGIGDKLEGVNGDIFAAPPGGALTIIDTEYLKNLPVNSGISWEDLVASLKNYGYNIGTVKLSSEGKNLIFMIALSGETGKRDFTIVLHNF